MKIIKKEIIIEEDLKQKLEIICSFCNTKPTIINGSIRSINKTNLNYIEPHKIIIKGIIIPITTVIHTNLKVRKTCVTLPQIKSIYTY